MRICCRAISSELSALFRRESPGDTEGSEGTSLNSVNKELRSLRKSMEFTRALTRLCYSQGCMSNKDCSPLSGLSVVLSLSRRGVVFWGCSFHAPGHPPPHACVSRRNEFTGAPDWTRVVTLLCFVVDSLSGVSKHLFISPQKWSYTTSLYLETRFLVNMILI